MTAPALALDELELEELALDELVLEELALDELEELEPVRSMTPSP
jgi:hypothetical protein